MTFSTSLTTTLPPPMHRWRVPWANLSQMQVESEVNRCGRNRKGLSKSLKTNLLPALTMTFGPSDKADEENWTD